MKKMQMIMAVMVLTGCLLAQGCFNISLVSRRSADDVTKVGMFTFDPGKGSPEYIFALYDGNISDQSFSLIRLYAD